MLQEAETTRRPKLEQLRENVTSSFLFTLNNLLNEFRSNQSNYVRQIDARKKNVDSFLLATENNAGAFDVFNDIDGNGTTEELTIDQLQAIVENESMVREREKEVCDMFVLEGIKNFFCHSFQVIKISKSILELNTLFKDLASLVLDQGTILDRIDYNVEQSVIKIKSAFQHVQKAEKYSRNRKMHFIVLLAGIAIFLLLLLLATKV